MSACRVCAVCWNAATVNVRQKVQSYGMCSRSSPISPPHARVTSLQIAQQDKDAREVRHRLELDVTSKRVQHMRHRKKSLVVVDKLKDWATHGGGDVPFVARSRGSRSGDSRAVDLVEVDRWQDCSQ